MKKLFGWLMLGLSLLILIPTLWFLITYAFEQFGFWGGLLNLSILPITFVLWPFLRLFAAGTAEDLIISIIGVALLYFSIKLLNRKEYKIKKLNVSSLDNKSIPKIDTFDVIKAILTVPFSYYVLIFSAGLIFSIGALVIGLIYYIESSLTNRIHTGILVLIGIGVLVGVVSTLYSIFLGLKKKRNFESGIRLKNKKSSIYLLVEEVAEKIKTLMPDNIVLSFEPDLHVHQVSSFLVDGENISGRTLTIGVVFLKYLTNQELKAVIAHELSHFTGNDTIFSIYVYPTYKSVSSLINYLANIGRNSGGENSNNQSNNGVWMALPNLLPLFLLSKYFVVFKRFIAKIDRVREARADVIASLTFGSKAFSTALLKSSNIGYAFSETSTRDIATLLKEQNKTYINYFDYFDKAYYAEINKRGLVDILQDKDSITNEFDSHFSIKERINYLPDHEPSNIDSQTPLKKKEQMEYETKLSDLFSAYISLFVKPQTVD